jgi:hypothetical protein
MTGSMCGSGSVWIRIGDADLNANPVGQNEPQNIKREEILKESSEVLDVLLL